jgi:hypothetical protein
MAVILPVVHMNGTSRDVLLEQRLAAGSKIRQALQALGEMAPNARDYYPVPGRWEQAVAQHARRAAMLREVLGEIEAEALAIADGEEVA